MVNGPDSILTWDTNSSSTIQGNSSLTMAKEWVVPAAVATATSSSIKASTPEEDITILREADLLIVEGEKEAAAVAAVDAGVLAISPTSPTRRSYRRVRST